MPRTITNLFGLPSSIYNALASNEYRGSGDISITRLIAPPRIVSLRRKYEDKIVEDASDRVWSLLGSSVHSMMERSIPETGFEKSQRLVRELELDMQDRWDLPNEEEIASALEQIKLAYQIGEGFATIPKPIKIEKRLDMPIDGLRNPDTGEPWVWTLSGQPDIYEEETLSDYKVTSVFSFLLGDKPEWTNQLNLQAMLHRHHGDLVTRVRIIAILRDWSHHKARLEKDYPQCAVHIVELPLWTQKAAIQYSEQRVRLHQSAWREFVKSKFDESKLPMCTDSEKWYRGRKFPVIKQGNKRADRVFDTMEEAEKYRNDNIASLKPGKKYVPIVERPGEYIRCATYCDVSEFCAFGQKIKEQQKVEKHIEHAEDTVSVEAGE